VTDLQIEPVALVLLGAPNKHLSKPTELRYGTHGSLKIDLNKNAWFDHEANCGGGVLDLVNREIGGDHSDARRWLADNGLEAKPNGHAAGTGRRIVDTYDYRNEHRELLFQAVRYEPKGFSQRRPNTNGWTWNLEGVRRVPYRLPELIEAIDAKKDVVIVEGEKDVDALRGLGIAATTCPGGAGKWRDEYSQHFKGTGVVVVGDNDDPGRDHARSVAQALTGVAARVRLIDLATCWPECPVKGDISDWLGAGGTREQLVEWIKGVPDYSEAEPGVKPPRWKERTFCADALQTMQFAPLSYLLPRLIPEGLCLLVSRPKLSKSWLVLDIAIATAAGRFVLGEMKPAYGEVLYLALEDGKRRLQRRLTKLLPALSGKWPEGLEMATEWPRSDQGGLTDIESWLKASKNPRLVIVDTLAQFRKMATGKQIYLEDYAAISELQKLASKYNVTIIVVHHDRKSGADDVFDTVSGSLGLPAAADTIAILKREASAVTLHVRGRDVEEAEKALQFDKATCRWTILGEASEVRRSDERSRVLIALGEAGEPLPITEIISLAHLVGRNAADNLLLRMVRDGDVVRIKRGLYCLPETQDSKRMREMREKDRSGRKPLKDQEDNAESLNLTHLTQVSKGERKLAAAEDYLGPPGDNPADFLGDIPDFLDRRKQQARN
jgi:5S rRNA maturation endonuclease (ribonuclease M5)